MRILVVNAGSSSLKLRLLDDADAVAGSVDLPARDARFDPVDVATALRDLGPADAVGHRVVHGGREFTESVRIDPSVRQRLGALTDLAPLHQPKSLEALDAVSEVLGDLPAVACFDTAFHATIPPAAATYAVPREWQERYAVRRYGFHGLSHAYASARAAALVGRDPVAGLRVVTCHLGAGASLAAVLNGRCVDTTMGFTPLEGLVMATRSGSVDPGLVLWLPQHAGCTATEVSEALEYRSGLLALAGTADMREVVAAADDGAGAAVLALEVYLHRLRGGIAAMTAALGGLDVLVFTGGVGERSAPVRARAAAGLGFLGVAVEAARNATVIGDADVTAARATVRTLVVAAREDLEISRETRAVLRAG